MPGATQLSVRRTMLDAGGYWRPLAAVARLLEELGELAELPGLPAAQHGSQPADAGLPAARDGSPRANAGPLAFELADLWIITTALADQFLAEVAEPGLLRAAAVPPLGGMGPDAAAVPDAAGGAAAATGRGSGGLEALLPAAGEVARVVNYYDGPKNPREASALPSLDAAVAGFHERLGALAGALGIDLAGAVSEKLGVIRASADMHRFARERADPSTAPVLARLRAEQPDTQALRLWGAPEAEAETVRHTVASFAKACGPERLDAFAIERGALDGLEPERLGLAHEPRGEFVLLRPS